MTPFRRTPKASKPPWSRPAFNAVCWAPGANLNDNVRDVDAEKHLALYRANVLLYVVTLRLLLERSLLAPGARLCVISSVWQAIARPNKLSYSITKAALQGFVNAASVDLGKEGLPNERRSAWSFGHTPLTHANLTPEQLSSLANATGFGRLARLEDVATLVRFLCSAENTGITGQFVRAAV